MPIPIMIRKMRLSSLLVSFLHLEEDSLKICYACVRDARFGQKASAFFVVRSQHT